LNFRVQCGIPPTTLPTVNDAFATTTYATGCAVAWLTSWTEVRGSNHNQGRNLVRDFCSTCAS